LLLSKCTFEPTNSTEKIRIFYVSDYLNHVIRKVCWNGEKSITKTISGVVGLGSFRNQEKPIENFNIMEANYEISNIDQGAPSSIDMKKEDLNITIVSDAGAMFHNPFGLTCHKRFQNLLFISDQGIV
jgi:hypothetical protein